MSSNTKGTTLNTERKMCYRDGIEYDKPTWIEIFWNVGLYDNLSIGFFKSYLTHIVQEYTSESYLKHFKKACERFGGKIMISDGDLLRSVLDKTEGMAVAALTLLAALELVTANTDLSEDVRGMAIFLMERSKLAKGHVVWIEYMAENEPDNLQGLLMDAREFPDPPFQLFHHLRVSFALIAACYLRRSLICLADTHQSAIHRGHLRRARTCAGIVVVLSAAGSRNPVTTRTTGAARPNANDVDRRNENESDKSTPHPPFPFQPIEEPGGEPDTGAQIQVPARSSSNFTGIPLQATAQGLIVPIYVLTPVIELLRLMSLREDNASTSEGNVDSPRLEAGEIYNLSQISRSLHQTWPVHSTEPQEDVGGNGYSIMQPDSAMSARISPATLPQKTRPCYYLLGGLSIGIVTSFALALWWARSQDDLSAGFTLGSYLVDVDALVVAAAGVFHAPSCRCWTTLVESEDHAR
ncbi:hypothetical protein F4801DRAFT_604688 [Xylaria longipes]|nr:hypothetical protein F4801DRAFT_604688 [Xylaria longipes]